MADDAPEAAADDAAAPGEAPTYRRPATAPKIKRMMQVRLAAATPAPALNPRPQRDEDVGKISQYTPLALGKPLPFAATTDVRADGARLRQGARWSCSWRDSLRLRLLWPSRARARC
jgi:hypothetical protein